MLGNERPIASAVAEIRPHADWYDYGAKYDEGGSDIVIPADIPDAVAEKVREVALRAFASLRVRRAGPGRLLPAARRRAPGQRAEHDPGLHRDVGLHPAVRGRRDRVRQLLDRLVELALERFERERRYRH